MGEPMVIDADGLTKPETSSGKKSMKRKRAALIECLSKEERESRLLALREEMNGLYKYFNEVSEENKKVGLGFGASGNSLIASLLEESNLPLSKLVNEIYEKVNERGGGVNLASVKSSVLLIGQRSLYGLPNGDADVLEDDSESCLWCWETKDVKLIPKSMRGALKIWRTCRKKINERITAVSAMIDALQKLESDQTCRQEMMKASERLGKVLNEADIRLLIGNMVQKNGADMAEKEGKRENNMLVRQMERNKREVEKERKKIELELQKEKLQTEKEMKRLQDEAEKEEKRREKEESELRKQLKRQQEEAEKVQRRREKEEAEQKKQLALQKQASIMERFLKKSKTSSTPQKDITPAKITSTDTSSKRSETMFDPVTLSMDSALSQDDGTKTENIRKLHLNSWRRLGHSIRSNGKQHWGIRRIPKTELVKELKLTTSRHLHDDDDMSIQKLSNDWGETNIDSSQPQTNADGSLSTVPKWKRKKQLLQFDKSHRPAFYGYWPKKSQVIGPRHPFVKDPDLEYEIDSDEEWEEEEPGESLSDCDKDDGEESLEEEPSKAEDEEDESGDGFFVPDGYLSENEGVQEDRMECEEVEEARSSPSQQVVSEELCVFFRRQKYLYNLTEHALRKNRPLIISNLMHEKIASVSAQDLTGTLEPEQTCLLALSMRAFPGCTFIEISVTEDVQEENLEASPSTSKGNTTPVATGAAILDTDLPQIVSVIQASLQSINKVVESLQIKFPTASKTQLRNKIREIADFTDNHWQVKKDILDKLGLSPSRVRSGRKTKNIAAFFSKRCLPPAGKTLNPSETSTESSQKPELATQLFPN